MKKILSLVVVLGTAAALHAQGTFDPGTSNSDSGFGAHTGGTIFDSTAGGAKAFGSGYQGQYYIGPAGTANINALVAVGPTAGFSGSSAASLSAGYYNGDGSGTVSTSFAPGTSVVVALKAWKGTAGSTFANATVSGASSLITIALGGVGSPPSLPTPITTMANFNLTTVGPEPATIALGLMGAGALFIRRRKV
jgi:hypothetical protein